MNVTIPGACLLAAVLVCAPARSAGESGIDWKDLSPERKEIALVHELGTIGLTADVATLVRQGKTEQALRILDRMLSTSVEAADELVEAGGRLPRVPSLLSLREAPARAQRYASSNGLTDTANRAAAPAASLK